MSLEKVDITIIGAGVIGLACAAALADNKRSIFILERHEAYGQETSSRNSEVIHAGIYYPNGSLKAGLCVRGRRLLYDICQKNDLPHQRIGKVIAAVAAAELPRLEQLFELGRSNGVADLKKLSQAEVKQLEPDIAAVAGIYSPSTGIIDAHSLMKFYYEKARQGGAELSCASTVTALERSADGYIVTVTDPDGERFSFFSSRLINCAGLESDRIAALLGIRDYEIKTCKGDYFSVGNNKKSRLKHLVYPVPQEKSSGLGVHATFNLQGELRLGPDATYIPRDALTYDINPDKAADFYLAARSLFPFIELADLSPDTSGIRPKLQGPGEGFCDFIIREEKQKGLPGFI
ncbi:MAG: NAD(P)/FAD-dependent oxidoreductase, partial [Candidatus Saganbacteria bacterium]|nr:NAD(P)/FAD-dependent oxidoreductase [Candidatus Saganbacteria bacterium]